MDNKIPKTLTAALCILFAVAFIFAVILILPVYRNYINMQKKVTTLEQQKERIREEYQTLLQQVHDLSHDSFAIEKVAREKYHQCKKDELIIIYR